MLVMRLPKRSNFQHHGAQAAFARGLWPGRGEAHVILDLVSEFVRIDHLSEIRRHWSKHVAGMKRAAHRRSEIMVGSDVPHVNAFFPGIDHGEHTVIGRDEMISVARRQNRPPLGAHARVHDNQMDRAIRKIRIRLGNRQRAIEHIEGLHGMRNVHDRGFGHNVENDSLHRAHKMIVGSKIGGQSNDRTMWQLSLAGRQNSRYSEGNWTGICASRHGGNRMLTAKKKAIGSHRLRTLSARQFRIRIDLRARFG